MTKFESPVLWSEHDHPAGVARAIPAEFVRAVFEVKASFEPRTVEDGMAHLIIRDLQPYMGGVDVRTQPRSRFLPEGFAIWLIFLELRKAHENSKAAINKMLASDLRGYCGGVVLRGEGLKPEKTAIIEICHSAATMEFMMSPPGESLLGGIIHSDSVYVGGGTEAYA